MRGGAPPSSRRRFLIRAVAGVSVLGYGGEARADAIHDAAAAGNLDEVKRLLTEDPNRLDLLTYDLYTPLMLAVFANHFDVAKYLVEHGANVDARKADGTPPLYDAAYNGNVDMARLLLDHHETIDAANAKGETALHASVVYDKPEIARFLLARKANANAAQNEGKTPLQYAIVSKRAHLVPVLLAGGADLTIADHADISPLRLTIEGVLSGDDNPAIAAISTALSPISLQITNAPLRDAFIQLFTQAKLKATVDMALVTPTTVSLDTSFDVALRTLLRLGRIAAGQVPAIVVRNGVVLIGAGAPPPADEVWPVSTRDPRFAFNKTILRPVLENYLARAVTHFGLLSSFPEPVTSCLEDDIRMLTEIGAKFIGRCAYAWEVPDDDEAHFHEAAARAATVHKADPEVILQGAVFETATAKAERVPIPSWVFAEFMLPVVKRNFQYSAMLYDGGKYHDHWAPNASVPDMSKLETRLWFYYRARRYIDAGCEALHFGQVDIMDEADGAHRHWDDLLSRLRRYAARYARRQMVLCDAHTHGIALPGGRLLFDYHAYPLITEDIATSPQRVKLTAGYYNSIYGKSLGGITPSGWACDRAPYLAEVDNGGQSDHPGKSVGFPWVWGMDSISWFAAQTESDRNAFLLYADGWLRARNEGAHFQPPTRRVLAIGANGTNMYQANRKSAACPTGFNQEDTIRALFRA